MPELRKQIRKSGLKLQQIYKRIFEKDDFASTPTDNNIRICLLERHAEGPLPNHIPDHLCQQFKTFKIGKSTFTTTLRSSCWFLKNSEICIIKI